MKIREIALGSLVVGALAALACGDDGSTSSNGGRSGDAGTSGTTNGGEDSGGSAGPGGRGGSAGSAGSTGASSGAAGEGGAGSVPGPPMLLRTTPEPDATNVWFYAPLVLVFNEPLDPATVDDSAVTVSVAGSTLSGTVSLSTDGTTVSVELDDPPAMATTATIDVSDSIADLDAETFAGATWDYQLPLWQRPGSSPGASVMEPLVATGPDGALFVARIEDGELVVDGFDGSAWLALDGLGATDAADVALGADGTGRPIVAWSSTDSAQNGIAVQRWNGSGWQSLGDLSDAGAGTGLELAFDADDEPVLAWATPARVVHVERFTGSDWELVDDKLALATTTDASPPGFGFTMDGDAPVVARFVAGTSAGIQAPVHLRVERLDGTWSPLGVDIPRARSTWASRPSLVRASDGTLYVGFDDGDDVTSNGFVRRYGASSTRAAWAPVGHALDLVLDAEVGAPRLGVASNGELFAAWTESYGGSSKAYAARWNVSGWTTLAEALNVRATNPVTSTTLAVDEQGNPNVAFVENGVLQVKRYNGSPTLPFGLLRRASTAGCSIPPDATGTFPQTLTATGCFSDVPNRVPVAGAIPFELNSALWSDGAYKRRHLVIPDGQTIGYAATGALTMPIGTIIIKEFLYPTLAGDASTLVPMETRFLVKRCEDGAMGCDAATAWQGYSYQWNAGHTEATLLPDAASTLPWPYSDGGMAQMHVHSYPSRGQCVQCHNQAAGRVLGLQAGQLNRSLDYGGTVDNQLRALEHIGVLTAVGTAAPPRLPTPNDQSFGLEERARGYFHANCSHCHRAGGMQMTVDFRYEAPLSATNVCNKLVPGDPDQSRLYRKDLYRGPAPMPASGTEPGGGNQMPPLATLAQDPRQLAVTYAWIDGMQSCP
jgi:hypothetical protein